MPKSVSSSLRQLLQKMGDKLASRKMDRDQFVKEANSLADMSRNSVSRNWGDQVKDGDIKKKK